MRSSPSFGRQTPVEGGGGSSQREREVLEIGTKRKGLRRACVTVRHLCVLVAGEVAKDVKLWDFIRRYVKDLECEERPIGWEKRKQTDGERGERERKENRKVAQRS